MSDMTLSDDDEEGATRDMANLAVPNIPLSTGKIDSDNELTIASPSHKSSTDTLGTTENKATIAKPITKTAPLKGSPSSATGIIKTGIVLQKRYQLTKILGKGGFGAAYLAQDIRLKRACVVKQMLIPKGKSTKEIEIYQANFEQEASLLVQLNNPGHPSIPEIYDYFSDKTGSYLVMKYIEGKSLNDIIKETIVNAESEKKETQSAPASAHILWQESVRYAMEVCDALNYMHNHGNEPVTHRDVKPANILLGNDGRVWLVDFGLAKTGASGSNISEASGSVGYTPLEQWLGEATPTSDVYALGASTYSYL